MSTTISVRLSDEQAKWLEETAERAGTARGAIIRDQIDAARAESNRKSFMRLAGCVRGPKDLSARKGFTKR